MKTEEEFMAEFDEAHRNYVALRARAGFPFNPPDRTKPLPSWVLRNGERPAVNFVSRPYTGPVPTAKSVQKPAKTTQDTTAKSPSIETTKPAAAKTMSKAEQVRAMIREALAANKTVDDVIARAKNELSMGNAQAKTYVTENWARVTKG